MEIRTYSFDESGRVMLSSSARGKDWPVVYMIHNRDTLYIGETTSASTRMGQHLSNPEKQEAQLERIEIVFDDTYNKSVVLDFEQKLIKYCKADGQFRHILNRNAGQSAMHNYYRRAEYHNTFRELWAMLVEKGLAKQGIDAIENWNIFKYSPYNSLTEEQNEIAAGILQDISAKMKNGQKGVALVEGCAGTGKTVLAISMINSIVNAASLDLQELSEDELSSDKIQALLALKSSLALRREPLKIGLLTPISGIRTTMSKVFDECGNGLDGEMVIGPSDVKDQVYDILFVDESHRLRKRKNLGSGFGNFDIVSRMLGLDPNTCSQLDWALKQSKYTVLFYDEEQSIKGSDVSYEEYHRSLETYASCMKKYSLTTQMRCEGGGAYIDYVKDILHVRSPQPQRILNYDFRLYEDVDAMFRKIRELDREVGLCRTLAGFSWPWATHKSGCKTYEEMVAQGKYDIEIEGHRYIWNLRTAGWIDMPHAVDTIGCIHTSQGFDLNYVGVIFGREIDYDPVKNEITIDLKKFYDANVKNSNPEEIVKGFIINTYTTILARGIKGCYVYACNPNLREYLKRFIPAAEEK